VSNTSRAGGGPERPAAADHQPANAPAEPAAPSTAPGVLTTLLCERCGNVSLIRVKGCWYCEKCHHKFDCYGW
jgi:hypothetical protein